MTVGLSVPTRTEEPEVPVVAEGGVLALGVRRRSSCCGGCPWGSLAKPG